MAVATPQTVRPALASIPLEQLRAVAELNLHPLQLRAMIEFYAEDGELSPKMLAKRLDWSLGATAYHVHRCCDMGLIELVRVEPRRGAKEHFYRPL